MVDWRDAVASDPAFGGAVTRLALCPACGTACSLGPPPPAEDSHETAYYSPTKGIADRVIEPLRRLAGRDRLRALADLAPDDSVLEIGSGDGSFLAALGADGRRVAGIEPSAGARRIAAASGVESFAGGIEDAGIEAGAWGAVIAWHSLEHLEDPGAALLRAREWLVPGGLIVVAVPNRASLQARIGGDRWFHQDVPRHRTHFTAQGISRLLERSGFEVERVRHVVVEQNPLGMWQTLLNRITRARDVAYRAIKREAGARAERGDLLRSAVAALPVAVVAVPLELAAALAGRGGSVVVEARAGRWGEGR